MDLITFNALQRMQRKAGYNEYFPEKPVFAYHGGSTGVTAMCAFYGSRQVHPMRVWQLGNASQNDAPSVIRLFTNAEQSGSYYWAGNSGTTPSTNSLGSTSGYVGCITHSNTWCANGIDYHEELGVTPNNSGQMQQLMAGAGIVVNTDPAYRQGIDIAVYQERLWIDWIGSMGNGYNDAARYVNWTTLAGLNFANMGTNNRGMVGYNRKTNTLALMENTVAGSAFRIHEFTGLPKLHPHLNLKAVLEAAIANGRYTSFDISWSGTNNVEWNYACRVVPCDDGTYWLAKKYASNSLQLGRVTGSGSARTFQTVNVQNLTTSYGQEQGSYYGIRHMFSEDNSVLALYTNYYYYVCGIVAFFVNPKSALANDYQTMSNTDSSYGISIAPYGKSEFIVARNTNADGKMRDGEIVRPKVVGAAGSALPSPTTFAELPIYGYSTSTSYGSTGVCKVQPALRNTTEYREVFSVV